MLLFCYVWSLLTHFAVLFCMFKFHQNTDGQGILDPRERGENIVSFNFLRSHSVLGQSIPRKTPKDGNSTQGQKGGMKTKKRRTTFTKKQVNLLENAFSSQKYLSRDERALLARDVNLLKSQVRTWFQNRRYQLRHPRSVR